MEKRTDTGVSKSLTRRLRRNLEKGRSISHGFTVVESAETSLAGMRPSAGAAGIELEPGACRPPHETRKDGRVGRVRRLADWVCRRES